MKKEKMSLDQLDSLKNSLEDKLVKLKEELLEVENEIQGRALKSKIKEVSYDPGRDSCVVRTEPLASYNYNDYHNEINFWPIESDSIYSQFLSGRLDDIIFYESLDDAKMFLKSIIDEQVK